MKRGRAQFSTRLRETGQLLTLCATCPGAEGHRGLPGDTGTAQHKPLCPPGWPIALSRLQRLARAWLRWQGCDQGWVSVSPASSAQGCQELGHICVLPGGSLGSAEKSGCALKHFLLPGVSPSSACSRGVCGQCALGVQLTSWAVQQEFGAKNRESQQ